MLVPLTPREMAAIISVVESIFNQSPLERLDRYQGEGGTCRLSMIELFTGRKHELFPVRTLSIAKVVETGGMEEENAKGLSQVILLHDALPEMHEEVA